MPFSGHEGEPKKMSVLSLPAWLYARLMSWRETAYARGLRHRWRPPAPCISVGNIRWGGTGKTPLCQWLLHWANSSGLRCVVLTRGYKAAPPAAPFLVRQDSPASHAGDEPLLLARSAPDARIVVDPKRTRSGPWAWDQWRPDLFLLDDGFQHLPVIRDLNLVLLIPADLDRDWGRTIPAGPWREGPRALARADAFLVKAEGREFELLRPLIIQRLAGLGKPCFGFALAPSQLINLRTGEVVRAVNTPYLLVSGVARPAAVEQSASDLLQAPPAAHLAFGDHHVFTQRDIIRIMRQAHAHNASDVVCTAKDAVKLGVLLEQDTALRWWQLDVRVRFEERLSADQPFPGWLDRRLSAVKKSMR